MRDPSQFGLLRSRRFAPLFVTQFFGAFNDNLFKGALVLLITFHPDTLTAMRGDVLVNLCGGILILPFLLFSATAGQLADKFERSSIVRMVKGLEIAIVLFGSVGFLARDLPLLLGCLFLLGTHSAFFGPIKYALLPQHLPEADLVGGNGLIHFGTFLAILTGSVASSVLMSSTTHGVQFACAVAVAVAVAGYLASRQLPHSPAPQPQLRWNWNPISETWHTLRFVAPNKAVRNALLGISWFWFVGSLLLAQLPGYAKGTLSGGPAVVTLLFVIVTIGISAGSLLSERLSGRKVELGLVPFGSIGISVFMLDLFLASPSAASGAELSPAEFLARDGGIRILIDLFFLGTFGGFHVVPLYALVQSRTKGSHVSRVIAANNILNAMFMVSAAGLGAWLLTRGMSVPQLFLISALLNAAVALYVYKMVPEFMLRFIAWLLIHSVYRLRHRGLEHIPATGPALLACNHVSYVDAIVIMAACRRPIRFIMDHNIFKIPILGFVFRESRAIPIAPAKEDPARLEAAYAEVERALLAGDLIGIFPEGRLTPDGEIHSFRPGIKRIVDSTPVPVIPMALRGLWGSLFSRSEGRAFFKKPRGPFSAIELAVGAAIPASAMTPEHLQQAVAELRGAWR